MHKQFVQKIEELRRLIDDSRSASFLLAVSGGMDSMCMLDLFSQMLDPSEYAVAHCNFSLRGEESDGDQALVESRAAELGVRLFVKRFDTIAYAQEHGVSIEMAARELRYAWFEELCYEHGFSTISVAHNANDNAETLILNLLRGTGLNGLHGMEIYSTIAVGSFDDGGAYGITGGTQHVTVFRPMLEYTRKQIEGYVLAHKVQYRNDSSNFSSDYKRNRVRNEVFPIFEKINPSFVRTLNREIGYFAEAGSIVEDWCRSQLPNVLMANPAEGRTTDGHFRSEARTPVSCPAIVRPSSDCNFAVSLPKLLAIPHWRYLLYYILEPYGFNSQTVASIESLLDSDRTLSGKRFESPTHVLHTAQDSLIVVRKDDRCAAGERSISLCPCSASRGITVSYEEVDGNLRLTADVKDGCILSDDVIVVRGDGIYNFNGTRFKVEVLEYSPDMPLKQPAGTLVFDADVMRFPFVCRRWRQGDWLVPLGMHGKKKVSDLFTDLKYNALQKDASIILVETSTSGLAEHQHIAALLGVRIDDRYKVTPSTTSVIRISL